MKPYGKLMASLALSVSLFVGSVAHSATTNRFALGVAAGEVTPSSVILWAKTTRSGSVVVEVSRSKRFTKLAKRKTAKALAANDNTVQVRFTGLNSNTRYYYRFRTKGKNKSETGRFVTAPNQASTKTINFAITGDADAQPAPGKRKPYYNNFEIYGLMAKAGNHFNINLGDTIYSDSEVPKVKQKALTVKQKWAKYRQNIALRNLQLMRGSAGLYSHWDDHEFINDFSIEKNGLALYNAGVKAFRDYSPVTYSKSSGIYRKFRWGKNVELFFLDERSFRSAPVEDLCIPAGSKRADLGPTAPAEARKLFSIAAPELKLPPSESCLAALNSPNRTMLGKEQYEQFTEDIATSSATFKVIVNETPIQQFYALPYDRWEGYAHERRKLIEFLKANVKNAVFLSTDTHSNYVNDVRLQTLEAGGPQESGILEVVTGPAATLTFSKEMDFFSGIENAGAFVTNLFLDKPIPAGPGMLCSAADSFSYAQVKATKNQLKISLKDIEGKTVREITGKRCGPYTVKAKR